MTALFQRRNGDGKNRAVDLPSPLVYKRNPSLLRESHEKEGGGAAQDYIQLYEGDSKLLTETLEHIQLTATQILNAIGSEFFSGPLA